MNQVKEAIKWMEVQRDTETKARVGKLITPHGEVQTPAFCPVGTLGAVKAIFKDDLASAGVQMILSNTFHLYLKPGLDVIQQAGGLHKFASWTLPVMTDSGGYQVFSLKNRKVTEDGVRFQSPYDGSYHFFSPEVVIDAQRVLGSDIMVPLDVCPPYPATVAEVESAVELTYKWLLRAIDHVKKTSPLYGYNQGFYAVLQGGVYPELREKAIKEILNIGYEFSGFAIGGLSVGEPEEDMYAMTDLSTDLLPEDKPRHLLGVGTPANIVQCVMYGIDTFDCVIPTRNGRRGLLYTWKGTIYIHNAKWKYDFSPIDEDSSWEGSRTYTKAFLRHLLKTNEILGFMIATVHNIFFYMDLMREIREHIVAGDFKEWAKEIIPILNRRL